jgi:myb proto-oncogene protein
LDPNITMTGGRTGKWTADEDSKLKDAVQTHGGKNWDAIAALVPSRTVIQCYDRWRKTAPHGWLPV